MGEFFYEPATVTVDAGTVVTWTNDGAVVHTTTSGTGGPTPVPDGIWDSGILNPGQSFSRTFDSAGTFTYYCAVHPTLMSGTVTVTS